jgi:hypothetical protein
VVKKYIDDKVAGIAFPEVDAALSDLDRRLQDISARLDKAGL